MADDKPAKEEAPKAAKAKAEPDASEQTPSGIAAAAAGELADDASDEEKLAAHEKYMEALLKARRG